MALLAEVIEENKEKYKWKREREKGKYIVWSLGRYQ